MPSPLVDFQRDTAFALFVFFVVTEAFLLLLDKLRSLLVPLVWAFFFAIPILDFADRVEELVVLLFDRAGVLICRRRPPGVLRFRRARGGGNLIYLESSPDTHALPLLRRSFSVGFLPRLFGQRVRIRTIDGGGKGPPAVGGLIQGCSYHAFPPGELPASLGQPLLTADAESTRVELALYLDPQKVYPAVVERPDLQEAFEGTLEVDKRSTVSWAVSMIIAFSVVGLIAYAFVFLIGQSVTGVQNNFGRYQKGVEELIEDVNRGLKHIFQQDFLDSVKEHVVGELTQFSKDMAGDIVTFLEDYLGELFLFFLYLAFWIVEPLPISQPAAKVFKDYMTLKTLACLLFAAMMAGLLLFLQCPIWPLYFFLTFLLNYIPEVGPMLAGLLMIPGVLLDADLPKSTRYGHVTLLITLGTLAKIITGNIIEVKLYTKFGGEFMHIHPVTLFVFFTFCGYQLGTTGMFLSIPILGAMKCALLSGAVPERYLHPLLTVIEGDAWAAHRNLLSREGAFGGLAQELAEQRGDRAQDPAEQPGSEVVLSEMRATSH